MQSIHCRSSSALRLCLMLLVGVLVGATASAQTAVKYWVDATSGVDSQPGTYSQPFKTLNKALQVVYDAGTSAGISYSIGVKATSGPIAPLNYGGQERSGWRTPAEVTAGCTRAPFPIRMIQQVDIVGELGTGGVRPVLTIVESTGHTYSGWTTCSTPNVRAMVTGATDARFENFGIDGSQLLSSNPTATGGVIYGVWIGPVRHFQLINCEVWDWHTQVKLDPEPNQQTIEAVIDDCDIHHAWPLNGNEGHAAIEFEGPGDGVVTMDHTTVRNSHDAFEPENAGGTGSLQLTCTNCTFQDNENGFELGGPYEMDILIDHCDFIDNFPHGSTVVLESNAIGLRASTARTVVTVRDSQFSNFSRACFWLTTDPDSILDLGTDEDPGNNTFCLDYTASAGQIALYRCCVLQKSVLSGSPVPVNIFAAGNWWLPNNQGAVGRELSIGVVMGAVNSPPPGEVSAADCYDEGSSQQFERNYSIFGSSSAIDFGSVSLSGTDPSPCADCENP